MAKEKTTSRRGFFGTIEHFDSFETEFDKKK